MGNIILPCPFKVKDPFHSANAQNHNILQTVGRRKLILILQNHFDTAYSTMENNM